VDQQLTVLDPAGRELLISVGAALFTLRLAGQALQRVLLTATALGLATTPISQPVEVPAVRRLLTATGTGTWAQMVLRAGYGRPAPATPRRPWKDVLVG